tara:strand:- start:7872 stop:8654 length:783 start_codon:yes stop_codon:yes gene_type:complete
MGWHVPRSYTDGEVITDTIFNEELKDNFDQMGTHAHSGSAGDGASILGSLNTIVFSDGTADPTAAGTLMRNGTSLKWHNDTLVVLAAGVAGSGTPSQRAVGTGGLDAANGTHVHTPTAVGTNSPAVHTVGSLTVAMGQGARIVVATGTIVATGSMTPGGTQRAIVVSHAFMMRSGQQTATAHFTLSRDGTSLYTLDIPYATTGTETNSYGTAWSYIDMFTAATARVYTVNGTLLGTVTSNSLEIVAPPILSLAQLRTLPS